MKIDIQSIHFDADKKLLEFITHKMEKVRTFFDDIKSVSVYLRLEKDTEKENKIIEVKLNLNGSSIFATEKSTTFEAATDMVMDKLVIQVKKYKDKLYAKSN